MTHTDAPTTTAAPAADDCYPPYGPPMSAAEEAFHAAEQARGAMAYQPDTMTCWACHGFNGTTGAEQKVVALAGVTRGHDPSQMYRLACGHEVIAS